MCLRACFSLYCNATVCIAFVMRYLAEQQRTYKLYMRCLICHFDNMFVSKITHENFYNINNSFKFTRQQTLTKEMLR